MTWARIIRRRLDRWLGPVVEQSAPLVWWEFPAAGEPEVEERCSCRDCLSLRYPVAAATPGTFLHSALTATLDA